MRLPPDLETAATAYAAKLGISRNALVAVALRDYLDARATRPSGAPLAGGVAEQDAGGSSPQSPRTPQVSLTPSPVQTFTPPKSRSDPCPCGSRLKWKQCHGKLPAA
jgi:predicted transcriptional regulator